MDRLQRKSLLFLLRRLLVGGLLLCGTARLARTQRKPPRSTKPVITAEVEPAAGRVLDAMARAYRELRFLNQETVYSSAGVRQDKSGPVKSRLLFERGNHLLYDIYQMTDTSVTPVLARFQCDGKNFYIYREERRLYTKQAAPKGADGFQSLANSLEMALITGLDPLPALLQKARVVRLESPVPADGVLSDVVWIDVGTAERAGEIRLFIGQKDHLLRRFQFDSRSLLPAPAVQEETPKPKPANPTDTTLLPPEASIPAPPKTTQYAYENHLLSDTRPPKEAFVWIAPPGAMLYEPEKDPFNPNANLSGKTTYDKKKADKTPKPVPLSELAKQWEKKRK